MSDLPLRESASDTTRDHLTIMVSTCKICDKGRDPLDVPGVSCGHDREEHAHNVVVPVVPRRDYEELEAYAKEGWDWLDCALKALGVESVFDIPGWNEKRELEGSR